MTLYYNDQHPRKSLKEYHVHRPTIPQGQLKRKFKRIKLKNVRCIAVDEICIGRPRKFLTIVLDLETCQIAGILERPWR